MLCKSSLFQVNRSDKFVRTTHRAAPGWKGSTTRCPYNLPPTSQIIWTFTGYSHRITDSVNCLNQWNRFVSFWTSNQEKKKLLNDHFRFIHVPIGFVPNFFLLKMLLILHFCSGTVCQAKIYFKREGVKNICHQSSGVSSMNQTKGPYDLINLCNLSL